MARGSCFLHFVVVATCLLLSLCVVFATSTYPQVKIVAGGGIGDDLLATKASVAGMVVFDSNGDAYVADANNHRIRKISNSTGIITTFAGTGKLGYSGDGGLAKYAQLNYPSGITINANDDIFFSETGSCVIRKISKNGTITTIAGTGTYGFSGDGGLATSAQLNGPYGIALGSNGDIYFADSGNHRIRKISISTGNITTIAGTGTYGFSGDGGLATGAQFRSPYGIALGSNGDIYIADTSNSRIRKVTISTGIITTIAGTNAAGFKGDGAEASSAQLNGPYGIALGSNGDIYIADSTNNRIRKISNGIITTIAGPGYYSFLGDGGPATSAFLNSPYGIALGSNGDIYFVDSGNHRIRKISIATGNITTIAGSGTSSPGFSGDGVLATSARLNAPYGIAIGSNGDIYFSESGNHRIRKISISTGNITTIAGTDVGGYGGYSGDGGLATSARLKSPYGIALGSNGDIYFVDSGNHRIRKISIATGNITTIAGTGTSGYNGQSGLAISTQIKSPSGIVLSSNDDIFFTDSNNYRICKISNGNITTITSDEVGVPKGIFLYGGMIYFTDTQNNFLRELKTEPLFCYGIIESDLRVCNGNGSCMGNDLCICNPGANCLPTCFGNTDVVCNNNGKCVSTDTCKCNDGWSGDDCSTPYCFGKLADSERVCNNRNGTCTSVNSCLCLEGFTGNECEIPICFGKLSNDSVNVCNSRGHCISNNTCKCNDGWSGNDCAGTTCYNIPNNDKNVCSGRGSCTSLDTCECIDDWGGYECNLFKCFGFLPNDTSVCNFRNGTCISNNTCSCDFGWFGNSCENIITCFTLSAKDPHVCGGNGICEKPDTCKCNNGWTGLNCSIPICYGIESIDQLTCSSHGSCISNNTCQCSESWFGKECRITQCYGELSNSTSVCSFNGKCKAPNICECKEGWGGVNCSLPYCFNLLSNDRLVCSSHGHCVSNNTCKCDDGWSGNNCSIVSCFGKLADSEGVCNNRNGTCISVNSCLCLEGFTGNECEIPLCFGKLSNDSLVCSSHGHCVSNNTCKCNDGWSGNDCADTTCYNIPNNDKNVCSGRGSCTGLDSCQCREGWGGVNCSLPYCFNLLSNDSLVCSSNGKCISNNTCICENGWNGNTCSVYSCNEIPHNTINVCSGHGVCSSMNKCDCHNGFEGTLCELHYCKGQLINISTICEDQNICTPMLNCSGNGDCDNFGYCKCYSNSSKGYWKNDTCNQCQENYFGKYCLTSFSGPARFLDDFSGIFFTLNGNLKSDQNIDCSSIIPSFEAYLYGSKPKCSWVFPSQFYINFGEGYQLMPNMLIHFNMLVFDNVVGSEKLISTNVILPLSPTKPTAQITQSRSEYGSCEEITIDGSSSFSPDNKPLKFIWTISQPSTIATEANSSYITFPKSAPSGDYSISLKVVSSLTGLESQVYRTSFKKKQISFPVVSIIGGNYVSKIVTQVPVVIGTVISLPECISNSSNSLSYNWEKITGPDLSMISNTKDLIITEFKEKTKQVYTFKLTVTSLENVDIVVSTFVYLNTTLEPFNTILYISDLTIENAVVGVEFSTNLDLSLESFKWACKETTSSSPCENSIDNALSTECLLTNQIYIDFNSKNSSKHYTCITG